MSLGVALAGSLAPLPAQAQTAREDNIWPIFVERTDQVGQVEGWQAAGPLLFKNYRTDGSTVGGFRPFWVQNRDAQGLTRSGTVLYPLFTYRADENTFRWSVFELIRRQDRKESAGAPDSQLGKTGEFEVWPFWFSRKTGNPEMDYRGLFPLYGTVKGKLGFERLSWTLFPLYLENERRGAVTHYAPWPIVRVTKGEAKGFGLWPLFEVRDRPGAYRYETYLWPFGYNRTTYPKPDAAPGSEPRREVGILPFYARSTSAGFVDQNYLWPFFGYTDRTEPTRYQETRYFWPFLVQGRGDDKYVNRWGPFYTHSIRKGYDKTWYMWPLVRRGEWETVERDIGHQRTQFFFFLYWSERQRSLSRPEAAPARLTHVWPLFSHSDNGAGRRQWQFPSPFEVLFPGNENIRQTWSPLVTLARHERKADGESRTSLLWNFISWERRDAGATKEVHVGPLFSSTSDAGAKRVSIGHGLFGWRREAEDGRWKMFWLDFASKTATSSPSR